MRHGSHAYATISVPLRMSGLLALLTGACSHPLSGVPRGLVNAGQLLIGCSLGARFAPESFRDSPRYMAGVVASALVLLGCAGIGVLVGELSGIAFHAFKLAAVVFSAAPAHALPRLCAARRKK
jgi:uncharacterized membrane protein AbrB (regulator of aidB expression)